MKRLGILITSIVFLLALSAAPTLLGAQSGSPLPADSSGVGGGPIGGGEPDAAPGNTLWLRQGIFEPGGYVGPHHHPGALVLYLESGSLVYSVIEGEATVYRAATDDPPGPVETFGPGEVAMIEAGDAVFEQGVLHTAENQGEEPTIVWISALATTDEAFTQFHEMGTPAP